MSLPIVIVDTETSGLSAHSDCLLEIGAAQLDDSLRVVSTFYRQIKPLGTISPESTAVHGLDAEALADAPELAQVIAEFAQWLPSKSLMAGHNVWFDAAFLSSAFAEGGRRYPFDYHVLDLWSISTFILPCLGLDAQKYDLDQLCALLGTSRQTPHNALSDALASAEVYRQLRHLCESRLGGCCDQA